MPRKATKAYKNEVWEVFYGINPKTFEVESVSKSRGGVLTRWGKEGVHTHPILTGRQARNEVVIVYGLTDIFVSRPPLPKPTQCRSAQTHSVGTTVSAVRIPFPPPASH